MLERIRLMNDWLFCRNYAEGMELDPRNDGFAKVALPHANVEIPFNYFDEKSLQTVSCYRKALPKVELRPFQRAMLRFEGVMSSARVYLDGALLGTHDGGYTPFEFPVEDSLRGGGPNVVTVVVDSTERPDVPPFGGQIDYLTYGGIYRDVSIDVYEPVCLRNARIICADPLAREKSLDIALFTGNAGMSCEAVIRVTVADAEGRVLASQSRKASVPSGDGEQSIALSGIAGAKLWSVDSPNLYTVTCELVAGVTVDAFSARIGFRTAEFRPDGFFLNGEPLKIRGLNRHQCWPYVGYAMPRRAQERDADILKFELRVNMVRASHYPQSVDFLNRCDEIGLLVFEEIPGWQHIGPASWKDLSVANVGDMVRRDWNHPSIVIWGVRINESRDDDEFYARTNALAHSLDPSRQTGGVRFHSRSRLLEDVYTKNDFTLCGGESVIEDQKAVTGLDERVPYLITEYNGHMYPTKKYDCEERQSEFAMRHLRVQNASYADPWISGAIGWCMFDYNTHNDFGAGDRICYHGVMDMFRIPKLVARVYSSQVSPSEGVVLQPVTFWARGERSVCTVFPLVILTNCDSVSLVFGDYDPIPVTKRAEGLSSLPYPPFIIEDRDIGAERHGAWGMKWEDARVVGYVGGKEVAEYRMSKNPLPTTLDVRSDDSALRAGEKDATRFVVSLLDQCGNPLPFCDAIVDVDVSGPARIQGPSRFVLKGGSWGFWLESSGEPGTAVVRVRCEGFPERSVAVAIG